MYRSSASHFSGVVEANPQVKDPLKPKVSIEPKRTYDTKNARNTRKPKPGSSQKHFRYQEHRIGPWLRDCVPSSVSGVHLRAVTQNSSFSTYIFGTSWSKESKGDCCPRLALQVEHIWADSYFHASIIQPKHTLSYQLAAFCVRWRAFSEDP